ncbi:hypothetical protein SAMN04488065_0167 [Haloplanus vescus]|uniref:Uncharacterized protein n=1 Tax=Haloplanus vescus TaxID=555874 RepID=A0A1H3VRM7_9EURY|nr:hypothetical protein [Haloplanus vescus]SDZ76894.1 hypothetical protein SAMN04488065_0167 [Haloplanus vescus]
MQNAAESLVERYQTIAPNGLRMAVWYGGDERELVYTRDDVREMYSPEEFDEKVKQLVVAGLGSGGNDQFRMLGEMDAVVRHFDQAVVVHFPIDEFTGLALTFDGDAVPSIDSLVDIGLDALDDFSTNQ